MKKLLLLPALLIFLVCSITAQKAPYRVVIDVTTKDTLVHQAVMRWVAEITAADPSAQVEVVFYAKGPWMVSKEKSSVGASVMKFAANKNVSFRVCEVAMKNNNLDKSQLLDGVGTVPDGIYEIISKQHEGWGYIKAAL